MGWVRLDDKFPHNPKILKAGPLGLAMHVAAICYCNQHLTNGFVPNGVTNALLNLEGITMRCWSSEVMGSGEEADWHLIVEDLVLAQLWHPVNGGWIIHDYLEYQPSKEKVLAERLVNANRQARFRNAVTNSCTNGVSNGHVTPAPTPTLALAEPISKISSVTAIEKNGTILKNSNGVSGAWTQSQRDEYAVKEAIPFLPGRDDGERWAVAMAAEDPADPNHRSAVTAMLAATKKAKVGWVSPERRKH